MPFPLFWIIVVGIAAFLLYRVVKYGGLHGMMMGAETGATLGEVEGSGGRHMKRVKLTVYALDDKPGKTVGLAWSGTSSASAQTQAYGLSTRDARQLTATLKRAIHAHEQLSGKARPAHPSGDAVRR